MKTESLILSGLSSNTYSYLGIFLKCSPWNKYLHDYKEKGFNMRVCISLRTFVISDCRAFIQGASSKIERNFRTFWVQTKCWIEVGQVKLNCADSELLGKD